MRSISNSYPSINQKELRAKIRTRNLNNTKHTKVFRLPPRLSVLGSFDVNKVKLYLSTSLSTISV